MGAQESSAAAAAVPMRQLTIDTAVERRRQEEVTAKKRTPTPQAPPPLTTVAVTAAARPSVDGLGYTPSDRPSIDGLLDRASIDLVPAVRAEFRALAALKEPPSPPLMTAEEEAEAAAEASASSSASASSVTALGADGSGGGDDGHGEVVKQGPLPAIANLLNCILAAGAVGGPYALASAGLPLGLLAYVGVVLLMDASLVLLVSTAISSRIFNYSQMCKKGLGWGGSVVLSLVQFGQGYGCMVAYLMVAADTFGALIAFVLEIVGHAHVPAAVAAALVDRRVIILALVIAVVLPLTFLKDITSLSRTSYLSIVSVLFIMCSVFIRWAEGDTPLDSSDEVPEPNFAFARVSFLEGLGIAAFSFVTHHEALLVYRGLEDGRRKNFSNVAHYTMLISCSCLLLIAVPGYLTFYLTTEDNILNNYAHNDLIITCARLMFGLTMVLTYPLEHFVSRSVVLGLAKRIIKRGSDNVKFVVVTLLLVGSSTAIAMFTTDLGAVLTLFGGVCASTLAYIMPGLLYLRLEDKPTRMNRVLSVFLVIVGSFLCIACPSWVIYRIATGHNEEPPVPV